MTNGDHPLQIQELLWHCNLSFCWLPKVPSVGKMGMSQQTSCRSARVWVWRGHNWWLSRGCWLLWDVCQVLLWYHYHLESPQCGRGALWRRVSPNVGDYWEGQSHLQTWRVSQLLHLARMEGYHNLPTIQQSTHALGWRYQGLFPHSLSSQSIHTCILTA